MNVENDQIRYKVMKMPATRKRYGKDDIDYATYIGDPETTVFLAYIEKQIAGQIILRKNWNNYAYIEDIVVDVKFRRRCVGKELISRAKSWAREKSLAGIMLETQNNNVSACKFDKSCDFQLGGFDKYLYEGLNSEMN